MNTLEMLNRMCHGLLAGSDVKAICKARGFPAEAEASPGVLETLFLSPQGLSGVFATLDSPRLLETVSGQLADVCLAEPRVEWVRVRLEKLDRYADAASVGLDMLYHAPGGPIARDH